MVLWELANCHNGETGQCNPGYWYLSRASGLSEPKMAGWIAKLIKLGDIKVRSKGRGYSNSYDLLYMENDEVVPSGTKLEGSPSGRKVSPPGTKGLVPQVLEVSPSGTRNQEGNQEVNQEEKLSAARSLSKNSPNGEDSTPSFYCTRCYPTRHETKRCPVPVVDQAKVEEGLDNPF